MNSATTLTPAQTAAVGKEPSFSQRLAGPEGRADYLMRQSARILMAGGTQTEALNYLQQYEGLKLPATGKHSVAISKPGGASATFGGPDETVDVPGWGLLDGLSAKALQGITFGFGDEAIGTLNGLMTGEGGQMGRDIYRAQLKQFGADNPKASLGAEVAGGIGAAAALPIAAGTGGFVSGVANAGKIGAGIGAVTGAGNTTGDISERAKGAVVGGILGSALGAGSSAGMQLIGASTRALLSTAQGWSQAIDQSVRKSSIAAAGSARELWAKAVNAAGGIDAVEKAARKLVREAGVDAYGRPVPITLADVTGDHGRALMQAATGFRSPGKQRVIDDMISRQADQGGRMLGKLFKSLRLGTQNAYDAEVKISAEQQQLSAPFYEKAHTERINVTPAIEKALRHPDLQKAYDLGRLIARDEDYAGLANPGALPVPPLLTSQPATPALYGAKGQQVSGSGPSEILATSLPVRAIDYMKRGLQQLKDTKNESGYAIDHQKGRVLTDLLNKALAEVDAQSPNFAKGRSIWRGHGDAQEALQMGKESFLQSHPVEVQRLLAEMPESVKPYYRLGAAQQIANKTGAMTAEAPNVARNIFGGHRHGEYERLMEQRVKALFPKAEDAAEFYDYVRAEAAISETTGRLGGSRTAPMSETMREIGDAVPTGASLKHGVGVTLLTKAANRARTGWTSVVSDELSNAALMGMNGQHELFAYLASLRSFATPRSAVPSVLAGQVGGVAGAKMR